MQVLAHGRQINNGLDAVLGQERGVSDTRELKEQGRDESAGRDDDFLSGRDQGDGTIGGGDLYTTGSSSAVIVGAGPGELVGSCAEKDLEVRAVLIGVIVCPGGIPADVEILVDSLGVGRESNHTTTVGILVPWQVESLVCRIHADGVRVVGVTVDIAGVERTTITVVLGVPREMASSHAGLIWHLESLTLQVVGEECRPVPTLVANSLPRIDLRSLGTCVSHT